MLLKEDEKWVRATANGVLGEGKAKQGGSKGLRDVFLGG